MLQSKLFYKTTKNKTADAKSISHDLLTRAGFIDQSMAGVYTFLPLGFKVLKNIENIIRQSMEAPPVNGQEVLMPVLQSKENWQKTGRWDSLNVLFKIKGWGNKEYALGPTHEEVVSPLAKKNIFSYKDLPLSLFQIQTKFRDELRVKSGILRTKEFLMKDLYSFHATEKDLDKYYEKIIKVYLDIFKKCGVYKGGKNPLTYKTLASGGTFSKYSNEFQTITDSGEDIIYICQKCQLAINKEIYPLKSENEKCPDCHGTQFEEKKAVEVGNIFKIGTRFSAPFNLKFTDKDAIEKPVIMGCFGIGLSRIMGVAVETSHDQKGIIWPKALAPFQVHLMGVEVNKKVRLITEKIYNNLQKEKVEVLYDDRQEKSVGEKFAEADLIGIPFRIVISQKTLKTNSVEVKERGKDSSRLVKISQLLKVLFYV